MIKKVLGGLIIAIGVMLSLYVGVWLMFVCSIMAIATAIEVGNIVATVIAWNLIKIFLASFVGAIIFFISCFIGTALIEMD